MAVGLAWLVRHRRCFGVIHCQQMLGSAMLGLLAKLLLRKPVLVRVTTTGELGEVLEVRKLPFTRVRLWLLRNVDRWVALTPPMKEEICSLGVAPERVTIIPNAAAVPVDAAHVPGVRERHRRALGLTYPQITVYTGRLSREKGLDTLLHAWELVRKRCPHAHLLLLGEGGAFRNVETELRALCRRLGLDSVVHFLGHVSNVNDFLMACDVFVLPTRVEGMSNSLVEAMAAGAVVVTTDIPANRVLIDHGGNGLLVQPDDPAGLASALCEVLGFPRRVPPAGRVGA